MTSLPFGGLLDTDQTFARPALGHELGVEADLSPVGPADPVIDELLSDQGWWMTFRENPGPHYHIAFTGAAGIPTVKPSLLVKPVVKKLATSSYEVTVQLTSRGGVDALNIILNDLMPSLNTVDIPAMYPWSIGNMPLATSKPIVLNVYGTKGAKFDIAGKYSVKSPSGTTYQKTFTVKGITLT